VLRVLAAFRAGTDPHEIARQENISVRRVHDIKQHAGATPEAARDIVVTTPRSEMANAAREAQTCIERGEGFYFRLIRNIPRGLVAGSKVFYAEDGFVRGFAIATQIGGSPAGWRCEVTCRQYPPGNYVLMDAASWKWIRPIPMKGFMGWRYFTGPFEVVGDWLQPRPQE
jgi:hypothetical protein